MGAHGEAQEGDSSMQQVRSRFGELRPPLRGPEEAAFEAQRCLFCGDAYAKAPCTVACPADIDVPGFIRAIADGSRDQAADIIFAENPVGGSCARVCPTQELCEGACVLNHDGERPVSIARLQRYATDSRLMQGHPAATAPAAAGGKVAVIGAGPSGLACASVLRSLGLSVTVFDARGAVGGLVRYAIAPYRLWASPLDEEAQQLIARGVDFQLGRAIDGPEALRALEREYDAIYLGVGLGEDTMLDLPGKDLPGVHAALPWIEALKAGEMPPLGERVAVIGGGNTAIDVAREALRLGAREVTMLYRRTQAEMPAYGFEVEEAAEEGVRFLWLTIPAAYVGKGHVEGVTCRYARLSEPDESGRRRPEEVPGTDFVFPCDTVITALGQNPRKTFLGWIEGLELKGGRIVVDEETGQTGNPKYFAGGDAVNGGATAVEAVREAKRAALAIARRLEGVTA